LTNNTIVSAVIVERLQGKPTIEETIGIPFVSPYLPRENFYHQPPMLPKSYDTDEGWRGGRLWKTLDDIYCYKDGMTVQRKSRIAAYQATINFPKDDGDLQQGVVNSV
jgi:hypothetical protein